MSNTEEHCKEATMHWRKRLLLPSFMALAAGLMLLPTNHNSADETGSAYRGPAHLGQFNTDNLQIPAEEIHAGASPCGLR